MFDSREDECPRCGKRVVLEPNETRIWLIVPEHTPIQEEDQVFPASQRLPKLDLNQICPGSGVERGSNCPVNGLFP